MHTRRLAPIALAAAVILGATGCSMISPQATEIEYAASDGININAGELDVRNVFIVADDDGVDGNFIAAIVNTTTSSQTLRLEIPTPSGVILETISIPAGDTLSFGTAELEPILLEGIDTLPGAMIEVGFSSGDSGAVVSSVPVLDGGLPQYADLVP